MLTATYILASLSILLSVYNMYSMYQTTNPRDQRSSAATYRIVKKRNGSDNQIGYQPQKRVYWFFWTGNIDDRGELWFSNKNACKIWIQEFSD